MERYDNRGESACGLVAPKLSFLSSFDDSLQNHDPRPSSEIFNEA